MVASRSPSRLLRTGVLGLVAIGMLCTAGQLPSRAGAYHITPAEKTACRGDAIRLCFSAYPSERRLLTCMRRKFKSLGRGCAIVFRKGLRTRGLHL